MSKPTIKIDLALAKKIKALTDAGLSNGLGSPKPGKMCVEAAVCYALGEEHSDQPTCVEEDLISAKIELNDQFTGTNKERGRILRRVAIAQLGTKNTSIVKLAEAIAAEYRKFVNFLFEQAAKEITVPKKVTLDTITELADYASNLQDLVDLFECRGDVSNIDPTELIGNVVDALDLTGEIYSNAEVTFITAEILTQALIRVKSQGSKFLTLVPLTKQEKELIGYVK